MILEAEKDWFENYSKAGKISTKYNKLLSNAISNLKANTRKRKEELSKSLEIINNINPEIAKNYISYYPTENIFKNFKNNRIVSFSTNNNKTLNKSFKHNNEEKSNTLLNEDIKKKRNIYFKDYYSVMRLIKNRNKSDKKILNSSFSKDKSKKKTIKL